MHNLCINTISFVSFNSCFMGCLSSDVGNCQLSTFCNYPARYPIKGVSSYLYYPVCGFWSITCTMESRGKLVWKIGSSKHRRWYWLKSNPRETSFGSNNWEFSKNWVFEKLGFHCIVEYHTFVKPKPKLLLWPITTDINNTMNQSELVANTCSPRQAGEKVCKQITISFGFTSDWLRKWYEIF